MTRVGRHKVEETVMRGLLLSFVLLLVAAPVSAQSVGPPAGTWGQIRNTAIYPVMPAEGKSSSTPGGQPELWNPADVFAYSGGDLVTLNGVLGFLYWGGGHAATPDNSVYWTPFDGSGPRRLTGPYLAPDRVYKYDDPLETYRSVSRNAPATVTIAAAPKSRHTYSSLITIEIAGKPYLFCFGGSLYTGSGSGTNAARVFDLTLTYSQAMATPDMGWGMRAGAPGGATSSSSGWDPVQKRVVTRSKGFIGAYYPATDRWENWNVGNAPYGSDYEASVAMDIAGRKMYVFGNRLAEEINLDTKVYTDLRSKSWAANFVKPFWEGGYQNGPGLAWHARTKQIVAWVGGNELLLINPAADSIRTITMGGVTVTSRHGPIQPAFGRFRLIPGTDQVVLANGVDQDVFIGTVPFDGGTPVPIPAPPPNPAPTPTPLSPKSYLDRAPTSTIEPATTRAQTSPSLMDISLQLYSFGRAPKAMSLSDALPSGVPAIRMEQITYSLHPRASLGIAYFYGIKTLPRRLRGIIFGGLKPQLTLTAALVERYQWRNVEPAYPTDPIAAGWSAMRPLDHLAPIEPR